VHFSFEVLSLEFLFQPRETITADGRAKERYRRAALTSLASMVAKAIQVGTALISLPITVRYLGTERYGLWLIISSVSTILNFMDFGMGNGLLNAIAKAHGSDNHEESARSVASAFFMLSGVAMLLLAAGVMIYPWVPWPRVFNVHSALAMKESGPAVAVFFTLSVLSMPLTVVQRVQAGYQQGYVSSAWQAGGSLLSLFGLLAAVSMQASLPWLVAAFTGGPLLSCVLNFVSYFRHERASLRPRWSRFDRDQAMALGSVGAMFFAIQLITAAGTPIDSIIIGQILGPQSVAQYGVVVKLVGVGYMLSTMFFAALWPAYGEAYSRGDYAFIKRTLQHVSLISVGCSAAGALAMLAFGQNLIRWYVGANLVPALAVIGGIGMLTACNALGDALGSFTMAVYRLKEFLIITTIWTLGSLPVKFWLAHRRQLAGFVWGSALSYGFLFALPLLLYTARVLRNLHADRPESTGENNPLVNAT